MSKYESLRYMKNILADLKGELRALEDSEPTAENLAKIEDLKARIQIQRVVIQQKAQQYGLRVA